MPTKISTALDAFYLEHLYCGELESGVEDDRVWMTGILRCCLRRVAMMLKEKER